MDRQEREAASKLMAATIESDDPEFVAIMVTMDSDHYNLVYQKKENPSICNKFSRRFTCPLM